MPIFEFACAACGERFEMLQSRAEDVAPNCPRCGEARVKRLLSAFSVGSRGLDVARGPCGSADCACRRAQGPS